MSFSIADPDSQHFIVHEVVNKRFDLAMFLSWLVKTKHTLLFHHIKEGVWTLHFIKKKSLVRKTKGAHLWALCGGWAIRPFQHRGSAPFVTRPAVGTYGTLNVSSLPSPPPEIIWQYPFDQRSAAASPMEVKCIKLYRRQNVIWDSVLHSITIVRGLLAKR